MPTWSSRLRGTNPRRWSSCRHTPSSPRRSCSPSTAASRTTVPAATWTRRPSRSSTRSSSRREIPVPTLTSCSTPSMRTAVGHCASRTLSSGCPSCCGAQRRRS